MAPATDNPSTPARRDVQALYTEYQKSDDPIRRQHLLSEICAGYREGVRDDSDDIWLLLSDVLAITASYCKAPDAAKWLLLETAHSRGFPNWWQHRLEGAPTSEHRGIDPRLWGKSAYGVRYLVDWKNSAVTYVRLEVSPSKGAVLEQLGDFLPAEPRSQVTLVRLLLQDVLKMLHRAGLLPDVSPLKPPRKVTQQEWWNAYLTKQIKAELPLKYTGITDASHGIRSLMVEDGKIDGGAYEARYIEKLLRNARVFPPVKR